MKKVLVTGATGFIGNYVIRELIRKNYNVIATSSSVSSAAGRDWFTQVAYIPFNLNEFNDSENYMLRFNKPDVVIHLAWEGLPNYKESFHLDKNLPRHFAFLKNLVRNGLVDLTVSGTCLEYGMKEGCLVEDMKAEPENPYAIAKNELRLKLRDLVDGSSLILKWVRLFYVYGSGQSSKSLISQLETALNNKEPVFNMSGGEQERDYLPVEDAARYIVATAMQEKVRGVINCCSGHPVKIKEFVKDHLKKLNKNIKLNLGYYPYTDYEPMSFWGDTTKLKSIKRND